MESSKGALETLWQDGEFILSRGGVDRERSSLLVMSPAAEPPALASLKRLEHAYALRDELDSGWPTRPVELVRHNGKPALLIADQAVQPVARMLGKPWDVALFLRVAIGLTVSLGQLHRRGLVHKDVKPSTIFVKIDTGEVWLAGFGIASSLPRERQSPDLPEVIAGTLAYMAPEQTARIN